jgi:quinoprotein dehydrogenase-associated probable ABC transporter substrate-binding protein
MLYFRAPAVALVPIALACLCLCRPAFAITDTGKSFDEYTAAEKTMARQAAKDAIATKQGPSALRICADPGNLPLSDDKLEGFENKIADVLARALGTHVGYFWRPALERGLTRQTFDANECDVVMDVPANYGPMLTTTPIYKTTYVFAYRADKGIEISNLDDPRLAELKIGVFQHSGLREALLRRGLRDNLEVHIVTHDADLVPENQPWRQVQEVVDGKLDVAGVWGPFAGYVKAKLGGPLVILPVNLMEEEIPMEFELALGVRKTDVLLKYMLDYALDESAAEIQKILTDYGVPLVQCSRCIVGGTLPAHGSYTAPLVASSATPPKAAPDQVVTRDRVEQWIKSGSSVQEELANALLAVDLERVKYVIDMGADVNAQDLQGYAALHSAARLKRPDIIALLLDRKAEINGLDRDGWTPLMHAAYRNHIPSIELLVARGAHIDAQTPQGFTALAITIEEGKFEAAKSLIEFHASTTAQMGRDKLTPLMMAASQPAPSEPVLNAEGKRVLSSIDVAQALIAHKADVNAASAEGVTALMIAAAHNNVPMLGLLSKAGADLSSKAGNGKDALTIADDNGSDTAAKMIKLLMVSKASPRAEDRDPQTPTVERK